MSNQTLEQLQAQIAKLQAENARLKATGYSLGMKITDKGGVSVYGLGRFPVTLYKQQWIALLDKGEDIRKFIQDNDHLLSQGKADKAEAKVEGNSSPKASLVDEIAARTG